MTVTETYCTECGRVTQATTPHCPDCGAKDPWEDRPAYQFDPEDLPYVVTHEFYNDTYGLWRSFVGDYFGAYELNGSDIDGLPDDFPDMKYCVVEVYFGITESYELEGPYLDRDTALEAVLE